MKKLFKPKDKLGYTTEEIDKICKALGFTRKQFNKAFGINTCAIAKDGTTRYYECDIERTLWVLGSKHGKYHEWD